MADRNENRSTIRTKALIREAYVSLLQEKEYGHISVSSIVERAGINRSTFYDHYIDVRELEEQVTGESLQELVKIMNRYDSRRFMVDPLPLLSDIVSFLENAIGQHLSLLTPNREVIISKTFRQVLNDYLQDSIADSKGSPGTSRICVRFLSSGLTDSLLDWVCGRIPCSREDLLKTCVDMVQERR